jgi:Uma2 family endonuclease
MGRTIRIGRLFCRVLAFPHDGAAEAKMTVDEFLRWADQQPEQRWELIDGEAVLVPPERAGHGETTLSVSMALLAGISAARLPCRVLPDSVVVRIDRHTTFQPDAASSTTSAVSAR